MSGPMMRSLPNGSIVILHKEYIRDMSTSETFTSNSFTLNPGLESTFPWLSQIADAYEEYRLRAVAFQFKSTSTPFVANQKTMSFGTIMMATQYNVLNPPFTNKRDLENYVGAQSGSPLQPLVHVVNISEDPLATLYVRTTGITTKNYDPRMYDYGRFEFATTGMTGDTATAASTCGELWVSYEVELIKPRFRINGSKTDHYTLFTGPTGNITGNAVGFPFGNALINNSTPNITGTNYTNGNFGIGTQINLPGTATASSSICFQGDSMANKLYCIEVLMQSQTPGSPLTNDATKFQTLTFTLPGSSPSGVNYLGSFRRSLFYRANSTAASLYESPETVTGTITNSGEACYARVYLQTNALEFEANKQYLSVSMSQAPYNLQGYNIDVIISEVDPQFYTNQNV